MPETIAATKPLSVLILEDREADARLMVNELAGAGYLAVWERVETEADYLDRLDPALELILADYSMPQFDALSALRLLRDRGLDIPFIIVSGSIGEELAVRAMQDGAADYLLKDRLARLGQAVAGALAQKQLRESKRQAEESLRSTERRLQQLVSSTPAVIYALKFDGDGYRPVWVGQSVEYLTGHSNTDFLAPEFWVEHVHPDDLERALSVMPSLATRGTSSVEYRFRCRDGAYRWLFDQKRLLRNAMGAPLEIIGSWLDVTDRKREEEQDRLSQKMEAVERLAGGVAHELGDLLAAISDLTAAAGNGFMAAAGYGSAAAADGLEGGDRLRERVAQVARAGAQAVGLTRQLQALSRSHLPAPVAVDLDNLLTENEEVLTGLVGDHIRFEIQQAERLWPALLDPQQWRQVLINLVVNARNAMRGGGRLTIATANIAIDGEAASAPCPPGEYVRLLVRDTGLGMDATALSHAFEPFFAAQDSDRGSGLRLAVVHGIVAQSGGHIRLSSAPGRGTTFEIFVPRTHGAPAPEVSA